MTRSDRIDKVIEKHLNEFRKPGVLTVRPGYKMASGWITPKPAIVVTVRKKDPRIRGKAAIAKKIGGYETDVRQASTWHKLRTASPEKYATLMALHRPEYAQPEFPFERSVRTGEMLSAAAAHPVLAAHPAKTPQPYTPAPGVTLAAVTDKMSITLCASPDAGWPELKRFLADVRGQLTVGMYDFTSAHVLDTVKSGLGDTKKLSLVLDHPSPNHTADQTDEQTEQELSHKLGKRQQFAWAAEARDPMVTAGFFPNAYHIKVAVKDHQSFWLSSGNWNNSNQPDIDPFSQAADTAKVDQIAKKSDRDWHAIVAHAGLAKTFEAFLQHDLVSAMPLQKGSRATRGASAFPKPARAVSPEKPITSVTSPAQYFRPLQITNASVKVQPVLTPDAGAGNYVQNFLQLIKSAKMKLYIQTQYIHPPNRGAYAGFQSLIDAVKTKISAGLDVRIILSEYEATGAWLEKLQEAGIDVPKAVRIQNGVHNKGFVVDSKVVALGSQNWSGDGVERNRDASLIIYHAGAAQYFEKIFLHDWDTLAKPKLSREAASSSQITITRGGRTGSRPRRH